MNLQEYKELSDKAYFYHSNNNPEEAEKIYKQLLEVNPDDVNVLNLYGLLSLSINKIDIAISCLSKAFILKKTAYIASNLAKAYYMNSEPKKAIKLYKTALELEESDDIYYSIAIAYKQLGDLKNVILNYEKAIKINPKNFSAMFNLSIAYNDNKNIGKAISCANKCLEICDSDEDVYVLLAGYYEEVKNYNQAINVLQKAVILNNKNYLYHYNLGVFYSKIQKNNDAIISYLKCIEINPLYVEAYVNAAALLKLQDNEKALNLLLKAYKINNTDENLLLSLAQTYKDLFNNTKSLEILNQILKLYPNSSEAYSLIASNYMDLSEYQKALINYEMAINNSKYNENYWHGKAIALKYLEKYDKSKEILENILKKNKKAKQTAITLGMMYLQEKDFSKGYELYSFRNENTTFSDVFKNKCWKKGIDLQNKKVLVYSNCGLGDTIMYSRFLNKLKNIASKVILQTDSTLVELLKNNFSDIEIVKKGITIDNFDVAMPIMDLQYALDIDFNHLDEGKAYLTAQNNLVEYYSKLPIFQTNKKKIGLFWKGNKKIFKNRSVDFKIIEELLKIKDFQFYSFEIDEKLEDSENFTNLYKYINNYNDTAALLKNIDILITIDSSIVHIAGALGINTYLLLPKTAEWRWFDDINSTIWYNSIKIFKQVETGNWFEVIQRVKENL
jgi:tetratricopeptide (TPR) repeat protein